MLVQPVPTNAQLTRLLRISCWNDVGNLCPNNSAGNSPRTRRYFVITNPFNARTSLEKKEKEKNSLKCVCVCVCVIRDYSRVTIRKSDLEILDLTLKLSRVSVWNQEPWCVWNSRELCTPGRRCFEVGESVRRKSRTFSKSRRS